MALIWRGIVGIVKVSNATTGSLEEFIRLLPEGIGVIPRHAGVREQTVERFREALESYRERVAELASLGVCDLIHPEGAPPFMVQGLAVERKIVAEWEAQYKVPVFTQSMTQVEAFKALGIQRFLGCTFYDGALPQIFTRYFVDAGFDVAGMETLPARPSEWRNLSPEDIFRHIKSALQRHSGVQGIYLHGSSAWGRVRDIVPLVEELGVPVVHSMAAEVWYVLKRLQISQPVAGA